MAYVLGFFAADGNMIENRRGAHFIAFYSNDKAMLIRVRSTLGSDHKIGKRIYRKQWAVNYQLQMGSKEMFADLMDLGMTPAKSNTLRLPKVPACYQSDFVRGYFDGDGCIYFNRLKYADRKNPRHAFMTKFTCGNRSFLEELHGLLKRNGVVGGVIQDKWAKRGFDLTLSHRDSLALFHFMYDTVPHGGLRLFRKYRLFCKAIRTLFGGRSSARQSTSLSRKGSRVQIPSLPH